MPDELKNLTIMKREIDEIYIFFNSPAWDSLLDSIRTIVVDTYRSHFSEKSVTAWIEQGIIEAFNSRSDNQIAKQILLDQRNYASLGYNKEDIKDTVYQYTQSEHALSFLRNVFQRVLLAIDNENFLIKQALLEVGSFCLWGIFISTY